MRWRLLKNFKGGHRFFVDNLQPNRIAIADESGTTPDKTDDGILYVDTSRKIKYGVFCGGVAAIPLVDPDGEKSSTPASQKEVEFCVLELKMETNAPTR